MNTKSSLPTQTPHINNPGFEEGLQGWISAGRVDFIGRSGDSCLVHGTGSYETTQRLELVRDGWYNLRIWTRVKGIPVKAYIALKDCGLESKQVTVPITEDWLQIVLSTRVIGGSCTISLNSEIEGEGWVAFDNITFEPGKTDLSLNGADISSLKKSEDCGGIYYDEHGKEKNALIILREHGMNLARIRGWVNSPDGYHGKAQILEMADRLNHQGIKLLVDFHYSDSWADPGKQFKPASWENLDFDGLKKAVYEHTFDICNALKAQGTPAYMVQIGNEINNGMVWPDGKNDQSFDNLATLLKEGIRAVRDCSPETKVMLHLAEGGNNPMFRWWFDPIIEKGVAFDLIGVSYYPYWHGTLVDLQRNLNDIAQRYSKDILLVETAFPFTSESADNTENIMTFEFSQGYSATPSGQKQVLADIMTVVRAVPGGHGLGFLWWDATWTAVKGNGWDPADPAVGNNWENQALFDYRYRPLPAMSLFKHR